MALAFRAVLSLILIFAACVAVVADPVYSTLAIVIPLIILALLFLIM